VSQSPYTSIFRRVWKPAAVTAAGGTAGVIWFEEMMLYAQEILAFVFLNILIGVIYLFNIFVFKSHFPKRDPLSNKTNGEKK
jgi:hypothetical protein